MRQEALLTDDSSLFLPNRPWPPTAVQPLLETALNGFLVPDSRLWHVNEAWTINVVPMQKHGRHWWLSPLTSWSKDDVLSYRDAHELPHNLVVDLLHKSSECLCGAFAKAGELEELSVWYPTVATYIKDLERRVRAAGLGWGWEERPPSHKRLSPLHTGQLSLPGLEEIMEEDTNEDLPSPGFSPLCSSCNARFERVTTRPSRLKANTYLVEKGES